MLQVSLHQFEGLFSLGQQRRFHLAGGLLLFPGVVDLVLELIEQVQTRLVLQQDGADMVEKTIEIVAQLTLSLFPQFGVLLLFLIVG